MNKNRVERTSANEFNCAGSGERLRIGPFRRRCCRKVHSRTALYGYSDCIRYWLAARQNA